jgi:acetyl-CoA carboxylase carboxyltransferase component
MSREVKSWDEYLKDFEERKAKILAMGGEKAVARQHERGKLTARERIERFFDPGTFEEVFTFLKHKEVDFGMDKKEIPSEGVVTGFGKVDGRYVCVWSQDFTSSGGTMSDFHGMKASSIIMDHAMRMRVPVVGMMDSGGARLQEGMQAGHMGYGRMLNAHTYASGSIPQIAMMMGPCGGGQGYVPAMNDIVLMVEGKSNMYIGGPVFVKQSIGEITTIEELGGSKLHSRVTGICDLEVKDDDECIAETKKILSYLPSSFESPLPILSPTDKPDRRLPQLLEIVPTNMRRPYDMKKVIREVVDEGSFYELKKEYAANLIIGFARFNGIPVGLIANQPLVRAGALEVEAATKIARHIRFCDAFNLPLVFLIDNPAYLVGTDQERKGVIKHGCKNLHAYAEATVPKISVILRKAYAGGYAGMSTKTMGGDTVLAWPCAVITIVVPEAVIDVIYPKGKYDEAFRQQALESYYEKYVGPWFCAGRGLIDNVIRPEDTRLEIIKHLEGLLNKKQIDIPPKKHGNIYL